MQKSTTTTTAHSLHHVFADFEVVELSEVSEDRDVEFSVVMTPSEFLIIGMSAGVVVDVMSLSSTTFVERSEALTTARLGVAARLTISLPRIEATTDSPGDTTPLKVVDSPTAGDESTVAVVLNACEDEE